MNNICYSCGLCHDLKIVFWQEDEGWTIRLFNPSTGEVFQEHLAIQEVFLGQALHTIEEMAKDILYDKLNKSVD